MTVFTIEVESDSVTAEDVAEILSRGGFKKDAFDVTGTAPSRTTSGGGSEQ